MTSLRAVRLVATMVAAMLFPAWSVGGEADTDGLASLAACAACHGPQLQGDRIFDAPNLSVLSVWYMERQLRSYKSGLRAAEGGGDPLGRQMQPIAAALDEAAIVRAARLVETVPLHLASATLEGDLQEGAALYRTCAACHGERGQGNPGFNAPRLAGQNDWYLVSQLQNYRAGVRGVRGDLSSIQMRAATGVLLNDKAVVDVVAYINTLDRPPG